MAAAKGQTMSKRHDIFIASEADRINNNNNSSLPRIIHMCIIAGSGVIYYIKHIYMRREWMEKNSTPARRLQDLFAPFLTSGFLHVQLFRLMISAAADKRCATSQVHAAAPNFAPGKTTQKASGGARVEKGKHAPTHPRASEEIESFVCMCAWRVPMPYHLGCGASFRIPKGGSELKRQSARGAGAADDNVNRLGADNMDCIPAGYKMNIAARRG